MSGTPAIRKVLAALKAALEATAVFTTVEIDRSPEEPYGNAEFPAANIVVTAVQITAPWQYKANGTLHEPRFEIGLVVENSAAATVNAQLDDLECTVIAALTGDPAINDYFQKFSPEESEGAADVPTDDGTRRLLFAGQFLTPFGDHRTLIAQSGPIT
ncbi:MAG TPA: hypothetical protein VFW19_10610 [Allosphingosinicella sp.]|nr:hypothetical protein [Allosphingosinicella sp.]